MLRLLSILVWLCVWTSRSGAVNYVFDEFLFSKDTWDSWKLDDPLEDLNPSDLIPKVKELYPGYELAEYNSIDGPKARLPPSQKASPSSGGGPDVDALDDESMVEPAAKAAQCTMCHVLVSVVWSRLTNRVISGDSVTVPYIKEQLRDACEKDALDAMLRKNTILRMERSGGGATSLLLFVVRERRDGSRGASATEAEEEAVALSCKGLVSEHGDDLADVLVTQLANYRREALRLLVKHGRGGGNTPDAQASAEPEPADAGSSESKSGSGSRGHLPRLDNIDGATRDEDDDYVDPDDLDDAGDVKKAAGGRVAGGLSRAAAIGARRTVRGLSIQVKPGEAECEDLNHMCASWAASGECRSNPNYMIGTDRHKGQCRKACGVCQPDDVLAGSPELASELDSVSAALLLAVKNLGCGAGGPCLSGVSGMAVGSGLLKQQLGDPQEPKELPPGMKQLPGGFILGKPWWAQPEVRIVPAAQRKPLPATEGAAAASSGAADGVGAGGPGAESGSSASASTAAAAGPPPTPADVDRVLAPALAHKLLSIPSDFFIYEYLYKNHTRHFHADRNGDITEDWLLGRFTRETVSLMSSATEEVAGLEELDLLPGSPAAADLKAHTWPYVRQVYAGGDECVLGGGRRVVRRVEARIACSPDDHTYMLIREPDFCTYIFVIYVPELCALDYYKPRPKGGAAAGAGGKAAGAGGGGSADSKKRRRTSGRGT